MDAHTQKSPLEKPINMATLEVLEQKVKETLERLESEGRVMRKSSSLSSEARKAGNILLKQTHNHKIHTSILSQYTKSIAFAPTGSEELLLGYSNRSILLMHLQRYEECLVDIEAAFKLAKTDDFKAKLQARKEKCLELIKEKNLTNSSENSTQLDNLASKLMNFKRSATLPCASDCVGLAYNETFGRHLVATKDIQPGQIVIVEEAYTILPRKHTMHTFCSYCLKIAWNGIPCDNCVFAIYCSEDCKSKAYQDYHDIECSIVEYIDCFCGDVFEIMAPVRLLITAMKKENLECILTEIETKKQADKKGSLELLLTDGVLSPDKFKTYYNLLSHGYKKDDEAEKEYNCFLLPIIMYLLKKQMHFFKFEQGNNDYNLKLLYLYNKIKDVLIELPSILHINTHGYCAPLFCECQVGRYCKPDCILSFVDRVSYAIRGSFVSPTCSMLNHSCIANVSRIFAPKRKVIVFANSPIKKGEQLFIPYSVDAESIPDVKARQSYILKDHHFVCECMACKTHFTVTQQSLLDATGIRMHMLNNEYHQHYSKDLSKTYLCDPSDRLTFTEEFFEEVKMFSKLLYKYLDPGCALVYNSKCTRYFTLLLQNLYGEKPIMPIDC